MSHLNDFGTRLKKLRTGKGLTQRQLADLMYISNSTIANWETGTRMPDINMLTRLARCLNVDIYTLIDVIFPLTFSELAHFLPPYVP